MLLAGVSVWLRTYDAVRLQIKPRQRIPSQRFADYVLLNFATLHFSKQLFRWKYLPLTVDIGVHKIVARDQSKRAQAGRKLWPKRNSKIKVIEVPVLVNQPWVLSTNDIVLIVLQFDESTGPKNSTA